MSITAHNQLSERMKIVPLMNDSADGLAAPANFGRRWFSREVLEITADALRFIDIVEIILAALISYALVETRLPAELGLMHLKDTLVGALCAPLVLHWCGLYQVRVLLSKRRAFTAVIGGFFSFVAILLVIGLAVGTLDHASMLWGGLWLSSTFTLFLATRLALGRAIAVMVRRGILRDAVAVVGGGPLADRLITHLSTLHIRNPDRCPIEVVGIFDDRHNRLPAGCRSVAGTLDDLITLGQEGVFDRVVLTLPWSAERRLVEIRNKLQALAIDISLCPDGIAFSTPSRQHSEFGELPFLSLAERPLRRWGAIAKRVED